MECFPDIVLFGHSIFGILADLLLILLEHLSSTFKMFLAPSSVLPSQL